MRNQIGKACFCGGLPGLGLTGCWIPGVVPPAIYMSALRACGLLNEIQLALLAMNLCREPNIKSHDKPGGLTQQ